MKAAKYWVIFQRKKDNKGNTKGHYYKWALDRLVEIEKLKEGGLDNQAIAKKIRVKTKLQSLIDVIGAPETRKQAAIYGSFIILLLILSNELGIIKFGKSKAVLTANSATLVPSEGLNQVFQSGTAFIPKNQKKLFVQANNAHSTYKVYVTFKGNYSPAARYWVSSIENLKGFTVELDAPVADNAEFAWWVTN